VIFDYNILKCKVGYADNDTKLELQLAIKLYRYQGDLLLRI